MKVASIQLDIAWENKEKNIAKTGYLIKQAKEDQCDLVVIPEMFNTGFSMNVNSTAEQVGGKTTQQLCELAKQYDINLIAGLVESTDNHHFNVALFISRNGKVNARYIKNHPFSLAGEDKAYVAGDEQVVFDVKGVRASVFICYDLRFPELFRKVAKEVEVIFVIANWPATRQEHWETLLRARAIENQCFVVGVNRIGKDGNGLIYGGGSLVFDPLGEELSKGEMDQEYIVTEIDIKQVASVRRDFPFLQDMR